MPREAYFPQMDTGPRGILCRPCRWSRQRRRELEMKIAVIGRGNVGGGLADLWEKAGHEVTRIGKAGGDVSEAEAVLVAVPGGSIEAALDNVHGLEGKTAIDATNLFGADRPSGFPSNA